MTSQIKPERKAKYARLPVNVVPTHYFITIRPDMSSFTFSGHETVDVEVRESTNRIVLNSVDIDVESASFKSKNQEHHSTSIELDRNEEVVIITFANQLDVGAGQLKLQFNGVISESTRGCYRGKYITPEKEVRYGLLTHFEACSCRRAFPCWDEPSLKAKFDLTIVAPKDRLALSNMHVVQETDDDIDPTKRVLKFATTPVMSTYLLCYIIGEYETLERKTKNNTQIRIFTPIAKAYQGEFALDVAVRCLEFFEEYFQIPYPLSKLDLIAVSNFQLNGMENWGIITFDEKALLYDPQNSSKIIKKWVLVVVCHELAHQWFGNLVTMQWWNDLWLKEGFATFMSFLAIDHIFPEYSIWKDFVTSELTRALTLDALHNSHPIDANVLNATDIEHIFDEISYKKGASLIRMLQNYVGSDNFQQSINHYLNKWAYKNSVTEDLWSSIEKISKKPIRSIMGLWTKKMGFPLINVSARQIGSQRVLTLSQEKFSFDCVPSEREEQFTWPIPIKIISEKNLKPTEILLEDRTQEIVIEEIESNEWIKLNDEFVSICRINYSPELLEQFKQSVIDKSLSPLNRLNLVDDAYALVLCGKYRSDVFLKFLEYFVDEEDYIVWESIISCLQQFNHILEHTEFQDVFHLYVRKLLSKIHSKLGKNQIQGEKHENELLRAMVYSLLIECKDPQLIEDAKTQFDSHVSKSIEFEILPDIRLSVYRAVARDCNEKTFEKFFELYHDTDLNEEKNRILRGMCATRERSHIQRIIDFTMSEEVRRGDAPFILNAISRSNQIGRQMIWNYFKANLHVFKKKFESFILIKKIVKFITLNFATKESLLDVSEFFTTNPLPGIEDTVQQSLEFIKLSADWLSRDQLIIKNYLTNSSQL